MKRLLIAVAMLCAFAAFAAAAATATEPTFALTLTADPVDARRRRRHVVGRNAERGPRHDECR
jgi:hypothetical protein